VCPKKCLIHLYSIQVSLYTYHLHSKITCTEGNSQSSKIFWPPAIKAPARQSSALRHPSASDGAPPRSIKEWRRSHCLHGSSRFLRACTTASQNHTRLSTHGRTSSSVTLTRPPVNGQNERRVVATAKEPEGSRKRDTRGEKIIHAGCTRMRGVLKAQALDSVCRLQDPNLRYLARGSDGSWAPRPWDGAPALISQNGSTRHLRGSSHALWTAARASLIQFPA